MAKRTGGFIGQDGINAPDPATGVSASGGDTQATVSFTAPSDVGGAAITGYSVQSNNGDGTIFPSYDIENASYDSKSFSVASQETLPKGLSFNNDGTKLYVVGIITDTVYQYSLTAAYDISTASYDSVSFSVASQATIPAGLFFSPDGTKFYLTDNNTDNVYQYNMSTAFDLSTASYSSSSFSYASQTNQGRDVAFNDDGTKMYVLDDSNEVLYQYSLSTAFDLSTASYSSISLDVTDQDTTPFGFRFNNDGSKLFVVGQQNDLVYQYNLSTAFNLSTASYANVSFNISPQETDPEAMVFNGDGSKMYILGSNTDAIYQYSTGVAAGNYPTASPVTVTGLTNGTSYTFNVWAINPFGWSSPSDASGSVSPVATVGVFGGGGGLGSGVSTISFVSINTLGNATTWGNLSQARTAAGGCASTTRGVFGGGFTTVASNRIDYITFSSQGNAANFGNLTAARHSLAGCSNETRGIFGGGSDDVGAKNTTSYITIASTGNSTNFGNLTLARTRIASCASPTRAIFAVGAFGPYNRIDYATIASTSSYTDFGDLTVSRDDLAGCSSSTRGVFAGGYTSGPTTNTIDYITIASTGNATDFGDLTAAGYGMSACSSNTRGLFAGPGVNLDYITIATTGNAANFGSISPADNRAGCSNGHGGLS